MPTRSPRDCSRSSSGFTLLEMSIAIVVLMVAADVRRSLVSRAAAARDYGVVVDEAGDLDIEATRQRRAKILKD